VNLIAPLTDQLPADWEIVWLMDQPESDLTRIAHDRVRVVPYDATTAPDLYRNAAICLLPAMPGTMTVACLEALASGCAVVATNTSAFTSVIAPGQTGMLVERDPAAVALAIRHLIEHPADRARLQTGAAHAARSFDRAAWRAQWRQVWRELGWPMKDTRA
jgi:glycosyltransferase involved in cell wall biosynthesis